MKDLNSILTGWIVEYENKKVGFGHLRSRIDFWAEELKKKEIKLLTQFTHGGSNFIVFDRKDFEEAIGGRG